MCNFFECLFMAGVSIISEQPSYMYFFFYASEKMLSLHLLDYHQI